MLEADGTLKQRTVWLGRERAGWPSRSPLPPAQPALDEQPPPAEPDRWRMSRLGRARATGETSETTILPTWLPTDPPLLLAAGFAGDLVAFDTFTPGAPPRWRFHTGGTVYGQPAYDSRDGPGLLRGERQAPLRPGHAGPVPLVVRDDGQRRRPPAGDRRSGGRGRRGRHGLRPGRRDRPRALDLRGRRRDRLLAGAGGRTPSSSARTTATCLASPRPRAGCAGSFAAGGAVEAPIVVDEEDGTAYVASRDGSLAAFKPSDCTAEACEPAWSVEPGGTLRTAPLAGRGSRDRRGRGRRADRRAARRTASGCGRSAGRTTSARRSWSARRSSRRRRGARSSGSAWTASDWTSGTPARRRIRPTASPGSPTGRCSAATASGSATPTPSSGDWAPRRSARSRASRWPGSTRRRRPPFAASQLRNTVAEHDGKAIVVDLSEGRLHRSTRRPAAARGWPTCPARACSPRSTRSWSATPC